MWVYPILAKLNLPLRVLFFMGTFLYAPFTYLVGEYLNNTYWGVHLSNVSFNVIILTNTNVFTSVFFINNNIGS